MASSVGQPPQGEKGTLSNYAFQLMREDILCGRLAPEARLKFDVLRKRYGLNVGILREGLSRLSAEGLVIAEEQKGFWVSPVSKQDLLDLTEVRLHVDLLALKRSMERGNVDWETTVLAAFHQLSRVPRSAPGEPNASNPEWEARHRAFHQTLVAGANSPVLLQTHTTLFDRSERYRRLTFMNKVNSKRSEADHKAIMDAAIHRDIDLACKLLGEHIEKTCDKVIKLMDQGNFYPRSTASADSAPRERVPVAT